jgi:ABC-type dipeptide/oligopeptide/nickel transport system ATPase component
MANPLLQLQDLTTVFPTRRGLVRAVDGMSFTLHEREKLGIVGESGSGKSVTLLSILRLVPHPGQIAGGEVSFQEESLLQKSSVDMRRIRGKEIAMIFQDPLTTLNPVFPVGEQIQESLRIHHIMDAADGRRPPDGGWPPMALGGWHPLGGWRRRKAEKERVISVMQDVGIPSPADRAKAYPHQFSGGMQQRAIIAIARRPPWMSPFRPRSWPC